MSEATPLKCENPQCKVGEVGGRCMDGITPATECKHLISPAKQAEAQIPLVKTGFELDDTEDEKEEFDPEKHVHLPSGLEQSPVEAGAVLNRDGAIVVAFVGFREAGKTSLFSSLYNLFQYAPIDGFLFAGSETLVAFEERCHDTRLASGRDVPVTGRSEKKGVHYLHLRVVDAENRRVTYLFADRSGEYFKDAINDTAVCGELVELPRADAIVVLVDGEKAIKRSERPVVLANCGALVQTLLDNNKLTHHDKVDIVLSKVDAIRTASEADREAFTTAYEAFKKNFTSRFSGKLLKIAFWEIAACPKSGGLKIGTGVEHLLRSWVTNEAKSRVQRPSHLAPESSLEIDKFGERYFRVSELVEVTP